MTLLDCSMSRTEYETAEFENQDQAIAFAMTLLEDGDYLVIHAENCKIDDDREGCTCQPATLQKGPAA